MLLTRATLTLEDGPILTSLGKLATTKTRLVLALMAVGIVAAAVLGLHATSKLRSGGFASATAPSEIAAKRLDASFGGSPNLILLVTARTGSVDSPPVAASGRALTARLASANGVEDVVSYWATRSPALRSRSGTEALIAAHIAGDDATVSRRARALTRELSLTDSVVEVRAGGSAPAFNAVDTQIKRDLAVAEAVTVPLTLLLLILAFGSAVAAALPVAIGLVAVVATLAVLFVVGSLTSVSQYALNLTTAMSLGLSIDYSLLMVNRYREEVAAGRGVAEAVVKTVETAGRTIAFSAATVAAAMATLLVFPVYFLRSFAYAGISVVMVATLGALVILPALLFVLGPRVNSLQVTLRRRQGFAPGGRAPAVTEDGATIRDGAAESPFWRKTATAVMRRPVVFGAPILLVLVLLGVPFLHVRYGSPDDRVLPASATVHQVGDALRDQFPADSSNTLDIVTSRPLSPDEAAAYGQRVAAVPGVVSMRVHRGATATWLSLVVAPDPQSSAAQALVRSVRAVPAPPDTVAWVGGDAASLVDQKHDIASSLPLALALIAITTFLVLWLFTGSVVLPLKALVLNVLSLSGVFGAMVWIFQYGHLSSLIGFTPAPISTTMPMLLFCIAFGLSMDYEVFMLSRIKELHDAGASNDEAIAGGLAKTGRIITTAAALLSVTFFAIATSKVSFIQMFGIGTGLAILADATAIRGILVPAFMRLAGRANWWSPPPLRRLHRRIGLAETAATGG